MTEPRGTAKTTATTSDSNAKCLVRIGSLSEHRRRREHEAGALAASRDVEAKDGRKRGVEPHTKAVVGFHLIEVEILSARSELAGVIEHRRVEKAVHHDPPLSLEEEEVLIAEAPALEPPHRGAAAERRHQEE